MAARPCLSACFTRAVLCGVSTGGPPPAAAGKGLAANCLMLP
jgi:hypothetical protein